MRYRFSFGWIDPVLMLSPREICLHSKQSETEKLGGNYEISESRWRGIRCVPYQRNLWAWINYKKMCWYEFDVNILCMRYTTLFMHTLPVLVSFLLTLFTHQCFFFFLNTKLHERQRLLLQLSTRVKGNSWATQLNLGSAFSSPTQPFCLPAVCHFLT